MTDPQDELEQRVVASLRRWTNAAPRSVDFQQEARAAIEAPPRRHPLFLAVIGLATVVAASLVTLAVLNLGGSRDQPRGIGNSVPESPDEASARPSAVLGSPGVPESITIDLLWENRSERQYWFVIGDVREGRLTEVFPIAPCEKSQERDVLIFWPDDVFLAQGSAPPESMDEVDGGIDFYTAKAERQWVLRIEAEDPPDDVIGNLETIGPPGSPIPSAAPEALC